MYRKDYRVMAQQTKTSAHNPETAAIKYAPMSKSTGSFLFVKIYDYYQGFFSVRAHRT
jgi:hypothetical protein